MKTAKDAVGYFEEEIRHHEVRIRALRLAIDHLNGLRWHLYIYNGGEDTLVDAGWYHSPDIAEGAPRWDSQVPQRYRVDETFRSDPDDEWRQRIPFCLQRSISFVDWQHVDDPNEFHGPQWGDLAIVSQGRLTNRYGNLRDIWYGITKEPHVE